MFRRITSTLISLILFLSQSALIHAMETNIWKERQQLASLPSHFLQNQVLPPVQPNTFLQAPSKKISSNANVNARFAPLMNALPMTMGSLRAVNLPKKGIEDKVVVFIQDVHMNAEAQKNIGKTVESLMTNGVVDLVALEGKKGPININDFRRFPNQKAVRLVADVMFEKGKISGPIYQALLSDGQTVDFVGVDDPTHYDANVTAYKVSAPQIAQQKEILKQKNLELTREKSRTYNKELLSFDQKIRAYHDESIPFGDYVELLANKSKKAPHAISVFLKALSFEDQLSFEQVERERTRLIEQLVRRLDKKEMQTLLDYSTAYRLGQIQHTDFYSFLKKMCQSKTLSLDSYPAMSQYIQYVLLSDQINVDDLFEQTAALENEVYGLLSKTTEEKELVAISRRHRLETKLIDFALIPEEWKQYKASGKNINLKSFEDFYTHAEIRDQKITENLLTAMDEKDAKTAVLVTGGFHSGGINALLQKENVAIFNFVPKLTQIEGAKGNEYLSVFTQEKTPLEKLVRGEKLFTAPVPDTGLVAGVLAVPAQAAFSSRDSFVPSVAHFDGDLADRVEGDATVTDEGVEATIEDEDGPVHLKFQFDGNGRYERTTVRSALVGNGVHAASLLYVIGKVIQYFAGPQRVSDKALRWVGRIGYVVEGVALYFGIVSLNYIAISILFISYVLLHVSMYYFNRDYAASQEFMFVDFFLPTLLVSSYLALIFISGALPHVSFHSWYLVTFIFHVIYDETQFVGSALRRFLLRKSIDFDMNLASDRTVFRARTREELRLISESAMKHDKILVLANSDSDPNRDGFPVDLLVFSRFIDEWDNVSAESFLEDLHETQMNAGLANDSGTWFPFLKIVETGTTVEYAVYIPGEPEPWVIQGEVPRTIEEQAEFIFISNSARGNRPAAGSTVLVKRIKDDPRTLQLIPENLMKLFPSERVGRFIGKVSGNLWYTTINPYGFMPPHVTKKARDQVIGGSMHRGDKRISQEELIRRENLGDALFRMFELNNDGKEPEKKEFDEILDLTTEALENITDKEHSFNVIFTPGKKSKDKNWRIGGNGWYHSDDNYAIKGGASQDQVHFQTGRFGSFPIERAKRKEIGKLGQVKISVIDDEFGSGLVLETDNFTVFIADRRGGSQELFGPEGAFMEFGRKWVVESNAVYADKSTLVEKARRSLNAMTVHPREVEALGRSLKGRRGGWVPRGETQTVSQKTAGGETPSIVANLFNILVYSDRFALHALGQFLRVLTVLFFLDDVLFHEAGHRIEGRLSGRDGGKSVRWRDYVRGMPWATEGISAAAGFGGNLVKIILAFFLMSVESSVFGLPPGTISIIATFLFVKGILFVALEVLLTPLSKVLGITLYSDLHQLFYQGGLPNPELLYHDSTNLAKGMKVKFSQDIVEAGERWAAQYIMDWQHFMFDADGNPTNVDVPTVFPTGDSPWIGYSILIYWMNNWNDGEVQRKLELYGADLGLKPDVKRIQAYPMDAVFPQRRTAYYAFAKQLGDLWRLLGIPMNNQNFFYGDLTVDSTLVGGEPTLTTRQMSDYEFDELEKDVNVRGLLLDEFLEGKLDKSDTQYDFLMAMVVQLNEMVEKLKKAGGPMVMGAGMGPGYDGDGHLGFVEGHHPNFLIGGFVEVAHNYVRKAHAKEDGGISNRFTKDGKPKDGVITFGPADLFRRGREGKDMRTIVIGTNNNKANSARRMLEEPRTPQAPLSVIQEAKNGTVILDQGSAHQLRLQANPWEFRVLSKAEWDNGATRSFFVKLSEELEKPISEITRDDIFGRPLRGGRETRRAMSIIRLRNFRLMTRNKSFEAIRAEVVEGIQNQIKNPDEIASSLGFKDGSRVLLLDPHADDSPLAARTMIESFTGQGHDVESLVMSPGYTSVHDKYVFALLRHAIGEFDWDLVDNGSIQDLTTELNSLTKRVDHDPDGNWFQNLNPWNQMNNDEKDLRSLLLVLHLKQWWEVEFKSVEFTKENFSLFAKFIMERSATKVAWGAADLKNMERLKAWVRVTENTTAMMRMGLPFNKVLPYMTNDWYTNQGRGPAVSRSDIDRLKKFLKEKKYDVIVSNREGFPDYGAHSNVEISLALALLELIDEKEQSPDDFQDWDPASVIVIGYAGVWENKLLENANLSVIVNDEQVTRERKEFGEDFPSQDIAEIGDAGIRDIGSFIDQVHLVNGRNSRRQIARVLGYDGFPVPYRGDLNDNRTSVLNYEVVNFKDPEFLKKVEAKKSERERVERAKRKASSKEINGELPKPDVENDELNEELMDLNPGLAKYLLASEGVVVEETPSTTAHVFDNVWGGRLSGLNIILKVVFFFALPFHELGHFIVGAIQGEDVSKVRPHHFWSGMPWETKGFWALSGLFSNVLIAALLGGLAFFGMFELTFFLSLVLFSNAGLVLSEVLITITGLDKVLGIDQYADLRQATQNVDPEVQALANTVNAVLRGQLNLDLRNSVDGRGRLASDPFARAVYIAHQLQYSQAKALSGTDSNTRFVDVLPRLQPGQSAVTAFHVEPFTSATDMAAELTALEQALQRAQTETEGPVTHNVLVVLPEGLNGSFAARVEQLTKRFGTIAQMVREEDVPLAEGSFRHYNAMLAMVAETRGNDLRAVQSLANGNYDQGLFRTRSLTPPQFMATGQLRRLWRAWSNMGEGWKVISPATVIEAARLAMKMA